MAKTIHELISERFGVATRSDINPEVATVGAAAVTILRQNPMRYAFVAFNLHATQVLFLHPNGIATATEGLRIGPGGSISVNLEDDFAMPANEWTAIADGAATNIFIVEVLGEPGP